MFCSNCGKGDQEIDTYCKGCGKYLYSNSMFRSDAPPDIAAWMIAFSAITVIVCLLAEIYPASKFSSNPAFISILLLQLFSILVGFKLRQRLKQKHMPGDKQISAKQVDTNKDLQAEAERLQLYGPPNVTEHTTKILDAAPRKQEKR